RSEQQREGPGDHGLPVADGHFPTLRPSCHLEVEEKSRKSSPRWLFDDQNEATKDRPKPWSLEVLASLRAPGIPARIPGDRVHPLAGGRRATVGRDCRPGPQPREGAMQIKLASVMVDDQEKALRFYTEVLGFTKAADITMGQFRWLTVSSPEGVEGVELVLEPMGFPPARTYQQALFEAGIPATAFFTRDIDAEYRRLQAAGVTFRGE